MDKEELNALTIQGLKELNIKVLNEIISNKQRDLEECELELNNPWNHNRIMEKALITFKVNLQEDLEKYTQKLSLAIKDSNWIPLE